MVEFTNTRRWMMRGVYVMAMLVIIMLHLVPLETIPQAWAAPDMIFTMTCAWVVRRPNFVPLVPMVLIFLLADLMLQRPPGLLAALMLIAVEWLRRRSMGRRDFSILLEWLTVTGLILAVMLVNRLVLGLFLVPQPPFGLALIEMVMTILFYPIAVAITYFIFVVRRASPVETVMTGGLG